MWPIIDEAITEDEIVAEREKEGPALELSLRSKFVTLRHLSAIVKKYRAKMKKKIGYYDCLALLRDTIEVPALRAFMEGKFTTMRAAFLQQLRGVGIEVTETDAL